MLFFSRIINGHRYRTMRIIIAMLILAGASASLEAGEIKRYETVTIKGMLGTHSDPKEDGFRITITNNDV